VHLWRREQGLLLAPGNPLGIRSVADLAGHRLAWRAPGTASRLLLERLLVEAGIDPRPGFEEAFDSHLGVAAAVGTGAADAGLAVRAVAHSAELEWIPVVTEPFELALRLDVQAAAAPLLDALASTAVHRRLSKLPGYDLTESGRARRTA
jgi:molybdate-binding protein